MRSILLRGLSTGAVMGGAALTTMMISSAVERGSPWAGPNSMTAALGRERVTDGFDVGTTLLGVGILLGGMALWGAGYEAILATVTRRPRILAGVLAGLLAYAVDAVLLPDAVIPTFERKLGRLGTLAKYAAISAVAIAAAPSTRTVAPADLPLGGDLLLVEDAPRTTLPWGTVVGSA